MALPEFTLTAGPAGFSAVAGGATLTASALAGLEVTFSVNIMGGQFLLVDGGQRWIKDVTVTLDSNGKINGNTGIKLLANDPSLDLEKPIQWTISFSRTFRHEGFKQQFTKWTFVAPEAGETAGLHELSHVTGMAATNVTRGPVGPVGVDGVQPSTDGLSAEFLKDSTVVGSVPIPSAAVDSLLGATTVGKNVVKAADAAAARSTLDAAPGAGVALGTDGQDAAVTSGKLVPKNPLYIDPTQAPYNVKFDRYTGRYASMSSTTNPAQLTVTGYTFTSADIGKKIKVVGAGSSGANLKTTISGVSSGKAVLASPCLTTVSNAYCIFGTDNATALNQLFADLSTIDRPRKLSRVAVCPMGVAMYSGTLLFPFGGTLKGASENWQGYDIQYARHEGMEEQVGTFFYQMWDSNVDCARVRFPTYEGTPAYAWAGVLQGFGIEQDLDNTTGRGLSFRAADGTPMIVIDGGTVNRVAVMGTANEGFEFPAGSVTATFRDIYAFGCGYMDRKMFTCDTTEGSSVLTNVSDFTGLAFGDLLTGPAFPPDSMIQSVNVGAGTIQLVNGIQATATGVSVQRSGSPGMRYKLAGSESVHFDGPSGDQNSGGLLRLEGPPLATGAGVSITNLKNEFGVNVYREPGGYNPTAFPSLPQGANAIVMYNMQGASVSIRGLTHWADASSSTGGPMANSLGKFIGAAIMVIPTGTVAPQVNWEALTVRFAAGNGQSTGWSYRDARAFTVLPIVSDVYGKGTNRPKPPRLRTVSDVNATVSVLDQVVGWNTITAARTATLPAISTVPVNAEVVLRDLSANASATRTITATPSGTDTIVGDSVITSPWAILSVVSDGTRWIGHLSDITRTGTQILTNTRLQPRIGTVSTSAAPTPDANSHDQYNVTALAEAATFAAPAGTAYNGQRLRIRVKDNGTARALTWNSVYRGIGVTLPTTTVAGKLLYLEMVANTNDTKWDVIRVAQEA